MSRIARLREIKAQKGPDGSSKDVRNLGFWERYASQNSHHGGTGKLQAKGPGRSDKNHIGSSGYMPRVRRMGS
jgi:hypothetical protein